MQSLENLYATLKEKQNALGLSEGYLSLNNLRYQFKDKPADTLTEEWLKLQPTNSYARRKISWDADSAVVNSGMPFEGHQIRTEGINSFLLELHKEDYGLPNPTLPPKIITSVFKGMYDTSLRGTKDKKAADILLNLPADKFSVTENRSGLDRIFRISPVADEGKIPLVVELNAKQLSNRVGLKEMIISLDIPFELVSAWLQST